MKDIRFKIAVLLGAIFFFAGVFTLTSYGINWDTINHLPRGQAYLHYFLTGNKDYSDLPKFFYDWNDKNQWYWQNPNNLAIDTDIPFSKVPTRSMYQTSVADFKYFMNTDGGGHPPLSDILSSAFNRVLFGKLRIINDIDSYRVYGVLLAAGLISLVFWWVSKVYGKVAGIISATILALYPLFWSEMHFNTEKDVPETVYWSFLFFSVWMAVTKKSVRWMILSGVFFGLALGTKFNILFAIFALLPWVFFYILKNLKKLKVKESFFLLVSAISAVVSGIVIFVGSWPYLWPDPLTRVEKVIGFYREIGVASSLPAERFVGPFGMNTYPLTWIVFTTPILVLIFFAIGLVTMAIRLKKEKDLVSLLFILWFFVPLARVSFGNANTYGGIRQIMEYIPAMAIIAGVGGSYLIKLFKLKKNLFKIAFISAVFIISIIPIVETHPNENAYFNVLAGGLSGAKESNFPYWGFSFGAPYRGAIDWINKNATASPNLVYAYELIPNIPRLWIRPDVSLSNSNRSGYLMKGEYAVTLTYQGTATRSYYDNYLETFLEPVYQSGVDGVSVVKVWKNDKEHLKKDIAEKVISEVSLTKGEGGLYFDLGEIYNLSRLELSYEKTKMCKDLLAGYVEISTNTSSWTRLPGVLPDDWRISLMGEQPKDGKFIEPFVGQQARYIHISVNPVDSCMKNVSQFTVYYFE